MNVRFLNVVVYALAIAAPFGACGVGDDRAQARAAAERFNAAIRQDDGAAACEELAEDTVKQLQSQSGQACADVVTRLEYRGGAVDRVEVYATNAKVDLDSGESAILSVEGAGWKLSAIGCKPEDGTPRDRPLDCEVEA